MSKQKKGRQISSRAVVNKIKIDSSPSVVFNASGNDIIPFGIDNIYPQRIFEAIKNSPTARGCSKRLSEFVFGLGVANGLGDFTINRDGETLNDVLRQAAKSFSGYSGYCLHFNFNMFGRITEVFHVDIRYIRKTKTLTTVKFGNWEGSGDHYFGGKEIEIDLFNPELVKEKVLSGELGDYKGQVMYWSPEGDIYPTAHIDSASTSASYEQASQVYTYANIKNGFSSNTIIKYPGSLMGEETIEEIGAGRTAVDGIENEGMYPGDEIPEARNSGISKLNEDLQAMHGEDRAGGSVIVEVPVGITGEMKDFKMVENLSPTNVDGLFVNQNKGAKNNILTVYTMPEILLGVSSNGMFNQESFNDAFDYKNADTEGDRKNFERAFNSWLPQSVFPIDKIDIEPLRMKGQKEDV